ncbi:energy transducer TonB [Croceimicrobium sp.]|uniref:energy transducer TonB n=1 Tax=Croceimicrobium sp. TaxID=2828340 RepID=UPI003BAA3024
MKIHFLPLLFLAFLSQAQVIPFKGCSDPECSQERYFAIMAEVEAQIYAQYGFEYNDSLSFDFKLEADGQIKTLKSFAWINEDAISVYANALKEQINTAEMEAGKEFHLHYKQGDDNSDSSIPYLNKTIHFPEAKECSKFNEEAQLACAKYFISYEMDQALELETFEDDFTASLYYREGTLYRVYITRAPLINKRAFDALQQFPLFDDRNFKKKSLAKAGDYFYHYQHLGLSDSSEANSYFDQRYGVYIKNENWSQLRRAIDPFHNLPFIDTLSRLSPYNKLLLAYLENEFTSGNIPQRMWTLERFEHKQSMETIKDSDQTSESLAEIERIPVFKGCDSTWANEVLKTCFQYQIMKYVSKEFDYPLKARRKKIQGRAYVDFSIEKSGEVGTIQVLVKTDPLLDIEAIRVVSEIPTMKPALQKNKPVRINFTLPINVRLN